MFCSSSFLLTLAQNSSKCCCCYHNIYDYLPPTKTNATSANYRQLHSDRTRWKGIAESCFRLPSRRPRSGLPPPPRSSSPLLVSGRKGEKSEANKWCIQTNNKNRKYINELKWKNERIFIILFFSTLNLRSIYYLVKTKLLKKMFSFTQDKNEIISDPTDWSNLSRRKIKWKGSDTAPTLWRKISGKKILCSIEEKREKLFLQRWDFKMSSYTKLRLINSFI